MPVTLYNTNLFWHHYLNLKVNKKRPKYLDRFIFCNIYKFIISDNKCSFYIILPQYHIHI